MAKLSQREFLSNFYKTLSYEGDMYFSSGSVRQDYKNITDTIKAQGYWAGNGVRYMFDENLNFIGTEERRFGS